MCCRPQAAPALAEAARNLGMIPSRDTAHLVQDASGNWVVVGTPKPAEGAAAAAAERARCPTPARPPAGAARRAAVARSPVHGAPAPTVPLHSTGPVPTAPASRCRTRSATPHAESGADAPDHRGRSAGRRTPRSRRRRAGAPAPARPVPPPRCRLTGRSDPAAARAGHPADRCRASPHEPRHRAVGRRTAGRPSAERSARSAPNPPGGPATAAAQRVVRVPAPRRQRGDLPAARRRRGAAVHAAGAARRRAARRGRRPAQGHRRRRRPCAAPSSTATATSWRSPSRRAR